MNEYKDPQEQRTLIFLTGQKEQSGAGKLALGLKDNRPESVAQKRQVDAMANKKSNNNSKSLIDIAGSYTEPIQLETTIKHVSGQYTYNNGLSHETVGKEMHAWLDPNDPVDGSDTGQNAGVQNLMMNSVSHNVASPMVRGHLLNSGLGGDAIADNLYPITVHANNLHKSKVEYGVKTQLQNGGVEYQVEVTNTADNENNPDASFKCQAWAWDPNAYLFSRGAKIVDTTIRSIPNNANGLHGVARLTNSPITIPASFPHVANHPNWGTSNPNLAGRVGANKRSISAGGCYITTAVTETKGLPDDCKELTTLRHFRDNYMSRLPGGKKMINDYYALAPQILLKMQRLKNYKEILLGLYSKINECVAMIEKGNNEEAMEQYRTMIAKLKATYL